MLKRRPVATALAVGMVIAGRFIGVVGTYNSDELIIEPEVLESHSPAKLRAGRGREVENRGKRWKRKILLVEIHITRNFTLYLYSLCFAMYCLRYTTYSRCYTITYTLLFVVSRKISDIHLLLFVWICFHRDRKTQIISA